VSTHSINCPVPSQKNLTLECSRVVELYGPESSGKTTLALHVIAEAQKMGKSACFIDAEHALDSHYASALGVDLKSLYLTQPDTGEQALEIADTLVRSGGIDIIVIDSVAALVPKAEIEGEMGDQHMALQARLMSQALRKLTASLSKSRTLIIFLNQIRSKVGVIFGSPDVTPGGNALKFYSSIRMEIRRTGQIKRGEEIVGNTTRVKVAKNKLAPPFRVADFEMTYGTGISRVAEAIDVGVTAGIIGKSGSWYSFLHQELVDAVNKALAGAPATDASVGVVAVAAAPAEAKKGKKIKKQPVPSLDDASDSPAVATAAHNHIAVGDNFMQGKENVCAVSRYCDYHVQIFMLTGCR
jgi:protein RecA